MVTAGDRAEKRSKNCAGGERERDHLGRPSGGPPLSMQRGPFRGPFEAPPRGPCTGAREGGPGGPPSTGSGDRRRVHRGVRCTLRGDLGGDLRGVWCNLDDLGLLPGTDRVNRAEDGLGVQDRDDEGVQFPTGEGDGVNRGEEDHRVLQAGRDETEAVLDVVGDAGEGERLLHVPMIPQLGEICTGSAGGSVPPDQDLVGQGRVGAADVGDVGEAAQADRVLEVQDVVGPVARAGTHHRQVARGRAQRDAQDRGAAGEAAGTAAPLEELGGDFEVGVRVVHVPMIPQLGEICTGSATGLS